MARLSNRPLGPDERGAVYVEFLFAFFPLFLLFLGICQLALIASAKLVVQHAALSGARSAIVVLEAPPERFGGAARGSLSEGEASAVPGPEALLSGLSRTRLTRAPQHGAGPQRGARMVPIRTSATMALVTLAPSARALDSTGSESLAKSLPGFLHQLGLSLDYTRAASVVTVHTNAEPELAPEPVGPRAPVTVRVTYLYHCSVPLVRTLVCSSLKRLLEPAERMVFGLRIGDAGSALAERMQLSESPGALSELAAPSDRFFVLAAEATLPNQGAAYDHPEGS